MSELKNRTMSKVVLKKELKEELMQTKGLMAELSREIGYGSSYISQALQRRTGVPMIVAKFVADKLGKDVEDIIEQEKEEPKQQVIAEETTEPDPSEIVKAIARNTEMLGVINASLERLAELYEKAWIDK